MANNKKIQPMAQTFRILGDQTRLKLMLEVGEGEKNVTELYKKLRIPQPTVSHHLSILRMGGLVTTRRSGKEIFYSAGTVKPPKLARAIKAILEIASSK